MALVRVFKGTMPGPEGNDQSRWQGTCQLVNERLEERMQALNALAHMALRDIAGTKETRRRQSTGLGVGVGGSKAQLIIRIAREQVAKSLIPEPCPDVQQAHALIDAVASEDGTAADALQRESERVLRPRQRKKRKQPNDDNNDDNNDDDDDDDE